MRFAYATSRSRSSINWIEHCKPKSIDWKLWQPNPSLQHQQCRKQRNRNGVQCHRPSRWHRERRPKVDKHSNPFRCSSARNLRAIDLYDRGNLSPYRRTPWLLRWIFVSSNKDKLIHTEPILIFLLIKSEEGSSSSSLCSLSGHSSARCVEPIFSFIKGKICFFSPSSSSRLSLLIAWTTLFQRILRSIRSIRSLFDDEKMYSNEIFITQQARLVSLLDPFNNWCMNNDFFSISPSLSLSLLVLPASDELNSFAYSKTQSIIIHAHCRCD